ncbi:MAG: hypothetical protein QGG46_02900, partial [Gammaproteobacteria bacterium]|nr:hypothetical protein [Gammaproteobacteria bacterium]
MNNLSHFPLFSAAALTLFIMSGCGSTPKTQVIDEQSLSKSIPFIRDGLTSRREILNRLGEPASRYEDGHITVYWMQETEDGHLRDTRRRTLPKETQGGGGVAFEEGLYNLVLV